MELGANLNVKFIYTKTCNYRKLIKVKSVECGKFAKLGYLWSKFNWYVFKGFFLADMLSEF